MPSKHCWIAVRTSIIDLRSIPLAPGEEETIIDTLGQGEVHARLDALGPSEIYETRYAGVWLITHYNEDEAIVSRFIEITEIPDILKSQPGDMSIALTELTAMSWGHKTHKYLRRRTNEEGFIPGRWNLEKRNPGRGVTQPGCFPSQFYEVLCNHGVDDGLATGDDPDDCQGAGKRQQTFGDLAVIPGMHGLHGVADTCAHLDH